MEKTSYISIEKSSSYRTKIIGISIGTSEGNAVGVILGKGIACKLIKTDGLPLGWSYGKLLGIWEAFLLGILERTR